MSATSSQIKIIFDGSAAGVIAASRAASAAIRSVDDDNSRLAKSADKAGAGLVAVGKGMLALGAANAAVKVIGGTAGALQQLAPAALLLPGALLGGAAAMATFKIATAGVGDALKAGLSGDMAKFAEATQDMAPAMQDAAKAVVAFKPQIDDLKKTVQGNFWQGFSGEVTKLGGQYLPTLTEGLGAIAGGLNQVGLGMLDAFVNNKGAVSDLDGLLSNTAESLDGLGPALGKFGTGLLKLAEQGTQRFTGLGDAVDKVATKFNDWVSRSVADRSLDRLIDNAIQGFKDLGGIVGNVGSILSSVFTGLGGVVESPLARIRELTAQVAEFMKTAAAQDGLRALGETLQVVGDVVGRVVLTAFKELAPTLVALAPVAQEVARTLGELLVQALQVLGPLIRGVADVFNAFPGSASVATVAVVGFVAAIKTIKAVNAVTDLLGIGNGIFGLGEKAKGADGKVRGFAGGLGLIKGALAAGAIAALAVEMDKVNVAAAGGADNLQGFERNLHNLVGAGQQLASGDIGGIIRDIGAQVEATNATWKAGQAPVQQWSLSVSQAATSAATAVQNFFRSMVGLPPLPPLKLDVDPTTGQAKVDEFVGGVSRTRGTAQLDADKAPADGKVGEWVGGVSRTRGTAQLDADPASANNVLGGWKGSASATVGVAQLNADPNQANGQTSGWQGRANSTTGTAHLNAEPGQANSQTSGWQGRANSTTGTAHLNAEPGQANSQTSGWQGRANSTTGTAHLSADASAANSIAQGFYNSWAGRVVTFILRAVGGAATGGPIFNGRAGGGPIHGPGTGTSDTAGLYALSNGEHVLTAREVAAAGGHAAIFALRRSLSKGQVPRMTAVRGRAAAGGSVSSSGALSIPTPQVAVSVHIGSREITDIVRTEIQTSNRQTRRTVGMGAGTTF